ncbi:MAG: hypothetical protein IT343_15495 [Candidatus Melainabacteria bacterium]|jgi:predicted Ser/Thr protein kinase|nr:hypothetical protein [Candidatus Melainabacteria bacterium]
MNTNLQFTRETHPQLWLPEDPFPYSFPGLKPTLKDFLKVVRENAAYVETTHAAFYRLNIREGLDTSRSEALLRMTGKEIPGYKTASKFFGVEEAVHDIVNGYGFQAAQGGRTRRKALTVTGAPGAGKSDLTNHFQYNVMRTREPIPFLGGSDMWANPLGALYLIKLVAQKKSKRVKDKTLAEIERIITSLDFTGDSELDFTAPEVVNILKKHGITSETPTAAELAQIVYANEKDFVGIVCFGLGLPQPTFEALVVPDPKAQDVVLGEFVGAAFVNRDVLAAADVKTLSGKPATEVKGKTRKDAMYGQFDADCAIDLADFPLDNMFMSEGQGMVDVAEVQPINFDLKVWRGDTDISALGLYDDRDPRTVSLSGVFNKGKFIVLTEGFRNPDEAFRILLEGLEGQRLSLPEPISNFHQQGVGWEGMILIHSNDEQWNKFWSNPAHRAHNDRLFWVSFKYPLEPEQSALVSEKLYGSSQFGKPVARGGVHREPLMKQYIGMFRVATHLDWASKGNLPFMAVLKAYSGEVVRDSGMGTELELRALREKAPWTEGLEGMSPREMDTLLGEIASQARSEFDAGLRSSPGFTVAELRDHMIEKFRKDPRLDQKKKDQWIGWLQGPMERQFRRVELSKVYKAAFIPNFADSCQQFFRKYQDYLKAINLGSTRKGFSGSNYMTQAEMERFLQEIERADTLQINSAQADKFRTNVLVAIRAYNEEHGTSEPPYTVHEGLKRCIEAYVLRQAKDFTGVIGMSSLSEDEKKRLDGAKARLIKEHGYDEYTAEKLLVEVALTRDFLVA